MRLGSDGPGVLWRAGKASGHKIPLEPMGTMGNVLSSLTQESILVFRAFNGDSASSSV